MKVDFKTTEKPKVEIGDVVVTPDNQYLMTECWVPSLGKNICFMIKIETGRSVNNFSEPSKVYDHYNIVRIIKKDELVLKEL